MEQTLKPLASDLLKDSASASTRSRITPAACPYCGTGCGVLIESRAQQIIQVRGDIAHPSNRGKLCPKGLTLHHTAAPAVLAQQRLLTPLLRAQRGAPLQPVSWQQALSLAAERFAQALQGPSSSTSNASRVAFYVSGQLLTEDYYVFNKLARALIGTNNIDSNSRLCMSSAVMAYKRTLGADAPPCCYDDLDLADCVLIAGANPAVAHPVLFGRLLDAKRARGSKLIVIDPRRSESAQAADLHLALAPGTDLYLLTALLGVMLRDGLTDPAFIAQHTQGFAAVAQQARDLSLAQAAQITGVAAADIERAARWFARSPASLSLWCQGLNQSVHGTDNGVALIHLHLATGQIGRAGAGPFSLTGQPNAMGGRETGTMATLLPGHRDPASAADRAEVAAAWGVPALPSAPGLTAIELFNAAAQGEIDALWIACTNPAQSLPHQAQMRAALQRVPFVVLQESFATAETLDYADLVLPAATFGERCGTSTNSERRITLSQAAVTAPGQARPDWRIAADFARELAQRIAPERQALFAWPDSAAVFDEYARLTNGRDLDISGLSHQRLRDEGPLCWPQPAELQADELQRTTPQRIEQQLGELQLNELQLNELQLSQPQSLSVKELSSTSSTAATPFSTSSRLYTNLYFATADGRARFVPIELRGAAEAVSAQRPIALTTVRLRDAWHGGTRTGTVSALDTAPAMVELAPATITALGLQPGELACIRTARGELVLPVRASERLQPGQASVPMHHGSRWLPAGAGINAVTQPAFDPYSRQPELKHAAASITPLVLPWTAALLARVTAQQAYPLLAQLRQLAADASYAAVASFGRDTTAPVLLLLLAHQQAIDLQPLCQQLSFAADAPCLQEPRSGKLRVLQLEQGRLRAVRLEGRRIADVAAWQGYRRLIEDAVDCSQRSLRELFAPANTL